MTPAEFDAELHRVMALPPLERAAAYVPLIAAARAALSAGRAEAMREAVAGGMTKLELARHLGISHVQVSKAIGEPRQKRAEAPGLSSLFRLHFYSRGCIL